MRGLAVAAALLLGGCTINQAGQDARDRLASISLADLDQALQWADLNHDVAAQQCFTAMRRVVVQLHSNATIGAVTTFQMGMDITNPAGYLNTECAAERAAVKARVQLFTGKAATIAATFGL